MKTLICSLLIVLAASSSVRAQQPNVAEIDARIAAIKAELAINERKLANLDWSLIHGQVLSVTSEGYLVSCKPAAASHAAMPTVATMPVSQDRLVWIARDPATKPQWGQGSSITMIGQEDGTHTYTTILGGQNTVANFCSSVKPLPLGSVVKLLPN
jgi:hypothetical protein